MTDTLETIIERLQALTETDITDEQRALVLKNCASDLYYHATGQGIGQALSDAHQAGVEAAARLMTKNTD